MPTVPSSAKSETPGSAPARWDEQSLAEPHAVTDKRRRVQEMFAAIAPSYDLNNRLHSLWMDRQWRLQAARLAQLKPTDRVVDVACGTGDLTLEMFRESFFARVNSTHSFDCMPDRAQVIGVDFTLPMLSRARTKKTFFGPGPKARQDEWNDMAAGRIAYVNGDAQSLPLADASTDVVSIAFGIRNVQSPATAFAEFYRVLRPGGRLVVLEFSLPTLAPLRALYNLYFRHVLPHTATLISGDKTGAYKYLPQSVNTFISRDEMLRLMSAAGFGSLEQVPMTFGICVCYVGCR